ncbi:hypothetical protein IEQ34_002705 [Dendrobium chrysotoxum]|uniref:Uncharacterized protein n=1 Tax=Dendrobium chrysotoxum TaxID=161865 RepID=A0AAV7HIB1_DENCH|nr:hypothetical protein IEQ34_002705 [Dendrobium chrysotoxum]
MFLFFKISEELVLIPIWFLFHIYGFNFLLLRLYLEYPNIVWLGPEKFGYIQKQNVSVKDSMDVKCIPNYNMDLMRKEEVNDIPIISINVAPNSICAAMPDVSNVAPILAPIIATSSYYISYKNPRGHSDGMRPNGQMVSN